MAPKRTGEGHMTAAGGFRRHCIPFALFLLAASSGPIQPAPGEGRTVDGFGGLPGQPPAAGGGAGTFGGAPPAVGGVPGAPGVLGLGANGITRLSRAEYRWTVL